MSRWVSRVAGGVAIVAALAGLFTGDVIAKNHERAATMYIGALVLVVAGVFAIGRPGRVIAVLTTVLVLAYVGVVAATFALVRP